jgi:hypothetical protein
MSYFGRPAKVLLAVLVFWICALAAVGHRWLTKTNPHSIEITINNLETKDTNNTDLSWCFVHDFGITKPGEVVVHTFEIPNKTDKSLTLARINVSCSCAATKVLRDRAEPKENIIVEVVYHTPNMNAIDRQRISLFFKEPNVFPVVLEVSAKVRNPLFISESSLCFKNVGYGGNSEMSFQVHNYGDSDWPGLRVESNVPWATAVCQPVDGASSNGGGPRQIWNVGVAASTKALSSGRHEGNILVTPVDSQLSNIAVPVSMVISPPIQAMPAQVFVAGLEMGKTKKVKVMLRFTPDAYPSDPATVQISHNLGHWVRVEREPIQSNFLMVVVTLEPPNDIAGSVIDGEIEVSITKGKLEKLRIPVCAKVNQL